MIAAPGKGAPKTESWGDMQRGDEKPRVITGRQALKDLETGARGAPGVVY